MNIDCCTKERKRDYISLDFVRWDIDERIALVGSLTLVLREVTLRKLLLPLVALAAGTLLGGALFHMIPASVDKLGNHLSIYVWILLGFAIFLGLEQFLHWHHCHRAPSEHRPLTYLILIADALQRDLVNLCSYFVSKQVERDLQASHAICLALGELLRGPTSFLVIKFHSRQRLETQEVALVEIPFVGPLHL